MVYANPLAHVKLEIQTLGWTDKGERIEPYDLNFLRIISAGVPETTAADPYNSSVRPIQDYIDIPGVKEWDEHLNQYRKYPKY